MSEHFAEQQSQPISKRPELLAVLNLRRPRTVSSEPRAGNRGLDPSVNHLRRTRSRPDLGMDPAGTAGVHDPLSSISGANQGSNPDSQPWTASSFSAPAEPASPPATPSNPPEILSPRPFADAANNDAGVQLAPDPGIEMEPLDLSQADRVETPPDTSGHRPAAGGQTEPPRTQSSDLPVNQTTQQTLLKYAAPAADAAGAIFALATSRLSDSPLNGQITGAFSGIAWGAGGHFTGVWQLSTQLYTVVCQCCEHHRRKFERGGCVRGSPGHRICCCGVVDG